LTINTKTTKIIYLKVTLPFPKRATAVAEHSLIFR